MSTCAGTAVTLTATNPQNLIAPTYYINPGSLTSISGTWTVNPASTKNYTLFTTGQNSSSSAVTTSAANYSVEIFNSVGQMIKSENITGSDHHISLENEQNGVYTVRVFQNNKIYSTNKLIKQ